MTKWEYAELRYDARGIFLVHRSALLIFLGSPGNSTVFSIVKQSSSRVIQALTMLSTALSFG